MANLIGTNPNQVPVNGSLGTMAFQDKASVSIDALTVTTLQLAIYTVAGLPTATAGTMAYCSDETGGAVIVFGDGTNWRRVTDRAIAS